MNHAVSHEDLMRYLDDELPRDRHAAIAGHIEQCTECKRELIVFQALKGDLQRMVHENRVGPSVWTTVNRRLMQPTAWLLLVAGTIGLAGWGAYAYATSPESFWEKLGAGAVVIGLALLLLSAIMDRLRDLKTDPYREIQR